MAFIYRSIFFYVIGDITPTVVKELDANLFQGEELIEVYTEIMQTVEDDHLLSHLDSIVSQ